MARKKTNTQPTKVSRTSGLTRVLVLNAKGKRVFRWRNLNGEWVNP